MSIREALGQAVGVLQSASRRPLRDYADVPAPVCRSLNVGNG